jgi:hypothetical protein
MLTLINPVPRPYVAFDPLEADSVDGRLASIDRSG